MEEEMDDARLLPTRARTAEERRLELGKERYSKKHGIVIRDIFGYDKHPDIENPSAIRFFPDGLEAVTNSSEDFDKREINYTLLVVEGKRQIIDFYYSIKK